jgi:hypothetical protein
MTTTAIDRLGTWRWRRLERRALAAHHREVVATLRRLGAEGTPVMGAEVVAGRSGAMLVLHLPGHRLALAGVAPRTLAGLRPAGGPGSPALVLSDAGRYGGAWWVTLEAGGGPVTVLGTHLRLVPRPRRHRVGEDGPDPDARRRPVGRTSTPSALVLVGA